MFTKDDFIKLIQEIGQCEDTVKIREQLATLNDEITPLFESVDTLTTENEKHKSDLEDLRSANMKLFLRVGQKDEKAAEVEAGGEPEKEKLKFEDLFNEKGGLK